MNFELNNRNLNNLLVNSVFFYKVEVTAARIFKLLLGGGLNFFRSIGKENNREI